MPTSAPPEAVREDAANADGFGGLYIFGSLADFGAGRPDQFRQAFGPIDTKYGVTSYGAFAQDHWSVTRKLTVDLGLRYDFEHLPAPFRQDTNNISPRAGLAFQVTPSWVVRAGCGIFFDRYVLASLNSSIQEERHKRIRTGAEWQRRSHRFP